MHIGPAELIVAGTVMFVLLIAPLRFAFGKAGFRHPWLLAIPASITAFFVLALIAGFTGLDLLPGLAVTAIAAIIYGFSR